MIGQLEQQDVISFGLENPRGWMVRWPSGSAKGLQGRLRYPTNMVHFDFQCEWKTREFLEQRNGQIYLFLQPNDQNIKDSTIKGTGITIILPFFYYPKLILLLYQHCYPVVIFNGDSDYRVGFLFSGQESQTSSSPTTPFPGLRVNLEDLPIFNASNLSIFGGTVHLKAPITTLLVCEPHLEYSGGEVQLHPNGSITIIHSQNPPIGIIDNTSQFLGNIFRDYISRFFAPSFATSDLLTLPAIETFLPSTGFTAANFSNGGYIASPLSLKEISSNLNAITTSIAKYFSGGAIIGGGFGISASSALLDVDGWVENEKLVLVTNPRLFCNGIGLWFGTICLLVWLAWVMEWDEAVPFCCCVLGGVGKLMADNEDHQRSTPH